MMMASHPIHTSPRSCISQACPCAILDSGIPIPEYSQNRTSIRRLVSPEETFSAPPGRWAETSDTFRRVQVDRAGLRTATASAVRKDQALRDPLSILANIQGMRWKGRGFGIGGSQPSPLPDSPATVRYHNPSVEIDPRQFVQRMKQMKRADAGQ